MGDFKYAAFISYSSKDDAIAQQFRALLEARGLKCWIAPRDLVPGRDWASEIVRGIDNSGSLVLLVSPRSNASKQVLKEVDQALQREKPVLPIMLEKVLLAPSLNYYIATIHWIQYRPDAPEKTAETVKSALHNDVEWRTNALAPSIFRNIRYSRSAFRSTLAAGLIVATLTCGALAIYVSKKERAAQAQTDASEISLGFVSLSAESGSVQRAAPFNGEATVFLYGADTVHSDVKLRLTGTHVAQQSVLDLSASIPEGVGGGASQLEFSADSFDQLVYSCLSLPHPRLHVVYRVTQMFRVTVRTQPDGTRRADFNKAAADVVAPEDGRPCGKPTSAPSSNNR